MKIRYALLSWLICAFVGTALSTIFIPDYGYKGELENNDPLEFIFTAIVVLVQGLIIFPVYFIIGYLLDRYVPNSRWLKAVLLCLYAFFSFPLFWQMLDNNDGDGNLFRDTLPYDITFLICAVVVEKISIRADRIET